MANKRYQFPESKISRWVKEGRGAGTGASYLPWLRVTDVPSRGFSHRVWCELTGRLHHYLSFLEYRAHLRAENTAGILDIRECYPLERSETRRIAEQAGIRHPRYPGTQVDTVMTTDLLLSVQQQGTKYVAWSVKPSSELIRPRVVEKLFIERSYHLVRGVSFFVITEKELPNTQLRNIERFRFALNLEMHPHFDAPEARRIQRELLCLLPAHDELTYKNFCDFAEATLALQHGDAHYLLMNLLGHGVLQFDLSAPWDVSIPMRSLHANIEGLQSLALSS